MGGGDPMRDVLIYQSMGGRRQGACHLCISNESRVEGGLVMDGVDDGERTESFMH